MNQILDSIADLIRQVGKAQPDVGDVHQRTALRTRRKKPLVGDHEPDPNDPGEAAEDEVEKVYASNDELPKAVRDKLSPDDQTKWRKVFNSAHGQYKDEQRAFATAWAAVKKSDGDDFEIGFDLVKSDPEQQLLFGWASVSSIGGEMVIDKQDDIIPVEEIEKAAYEFVLFSREMGDMHEKRGVGRMVESCVFTPEKAALGITAKNETGENVMGWWVGFKVADDRVWTDHKAGKRPELSIGGRASHTEIAA